MAEVYLAQPLLQQYHMLVVASWRLWSSVSDAITFLFLYLTCFVVENILSHTYVLTKSAFLLGNPSLLTNF